MAKPLNHQRTFLAAYRRYLDSILTPTKTDLEALFSDWRDPLYWARYASGSRRPAPSPIHRIHVRVKRPESAADKILRKPDRFPDGFQHSSLSRMRDAVGARIVVYFLDNLSMVDAELRNCQGLEISPDEPPVAYVGAQGEHFLKTTGIQAVIDQKSSGYVSIHYIARLRNSAIPLSERPWFEIQVRTLVEDAWAEVEHVLGYKPERKTSFAVRRQFQLISRHLQTIDEHFNFLYDELTRFQQEGLFRDVDLLNAENLPAVLSSVGIGCSQRELDGMLKLLSSRGVSTVGDLRSLCTSERIGWIRDAHREAEGREASNFELVASLAATRDAQTARETAERVKAQVEFLRAWDLWRKSK